MADLNKIVETIIEVAIQIGREGRSAQPTGTMFVVGDTQKVLERSFDSGVDPFRGYARKYGNLFDPRVQDDAKELAKLDGAFIVDGDGVIVRSRQILEVSPDELTMTQGLGARHWAAAAVTRSTSAIAVVVSQATGSVRVYKDGNVVTYIDPSGG
ncbi:MAG: diadenylate cyclase [Planctomycetota bacterium]